MAIYEYDKNIVIPGRLIVEIERESGILKTLDPVLPIENNHAASPTNNLYISFTNALTAGEKALLDTIVTNHPTTDPEPEPAAGDGIILEDVSGTPALPIVDGSQLMNLFVSLYGSSEDYSYSEKNSRRSTTSTKWVQYHRHTVNLTAGGNFLIWWYYIWDGNQTNRDIFVRAQLNDSDNLMGGPNYHRQEPKERSPQAHMECGFAQAELSSGINNIDIDFCCESSNFQSTLYIARILMWRISKN